MSVLKGCAGSVQVVDPNHTCPACKHPHSFHHGILYHPTEQLTILNRRACNAHIGPREPQVKNTLEGYRSPWCDCTYYAPEQHEG